MATDYPAPFIIPPRVSPHKQTFIILHGRGATGDKFGPVLLDTPIPHLPTSTAPSPEADDPSATTLASIFPHARFVFPSAARRRATVYRRAYTHQWFDNWKLDPPATDREDLQIPGLRETTTYLHGLLRDEIALVPGGAAKVVLGGLSQGCAAALTALLLWDSEGRGAPRVAAFGMCGWLPYARRMSEQVEMDMARDGVGGMDGDDDSFDPFQRDEPGGEATTSDEATEPFALAVGWLRDELGVVAKGTTSSPEETGLQTVPLCLGHGVLDDKVSVVLGQKASRCLTELGIRVRWNEYESLAHWYSGPMLRDIVDFLHAETG
ncbi:Uu.00g012370.m01.CDS01 [Anthostomella pinea]|uniref:Uu.00g012370.m01.CDS01 n=1 Tax=Anthostomella pinea TaxID=933095 RepID=A0AAI8VXX6_9PEZI|nr:Uu.00g012370.m01.CDS01 [Anthostomella pinea]